jgi:2,4-dienoyl-CoA reductase-like NADH-dependent reductase (Old Yellow Enzyme family)
MELNNRFVRSATVDNLGSHGIVTDPQLNLYRTLGRGEVGLIITGGLFPRKDGQGSLGQLGAHTDEMVLHLKKLVRVVHENDGKIAAQLMHTGWHCRPEVTGLQPIGPSSIVNPHTGIQIRELSGNEIHELTEDFVQAARRAIEAGFDAVQLHGAHSWLISSFLSPVTNRRGDEWGGSPERRSNFVRGICRKIRKLAGSDYPILVKLGFQDYHPKGKPLSEGIETARLLEADGIDAIEVSEGLEAESGHHIRRGMTRPYYIEECREGRRVLALPLILVGGMRTAQDMKTTLDGGVADAISMCRPFIMDPHIVSKFREGLNDKSKCTSCNGCLEQVDQGRFSCILV